MTPELIDPLTETEKHMTRICLDGALVPAEQAVNPVTDQGLLRGDGVFEVARLYDGIPYALDAHLERMRRSAENLRLPLDLDAVAADTPRCWTRAPGDAALRMLVTRGGHRVAIIEALPISRPRSPSAASPTRPRACSTGSSRSPTRRTCSARDGPRARLR